MWEYTKTINNSHSQATLKANEFELKFILAYWCRSPILYPVRESSKKRENISGKVNLGYINFLFVLLKCEMINNFLLKNGVIADFSLH